MPELAPEEARKLAAEAAHYDELRRKTFLECEEIERLRRSVFQRLHLKGVVAGIGLAWLIWATWGNFMQPITDQKEQLDKLRATEQLEEAQIDALTATKSKLDVELLKLQAEVKAKTSEADVAKLRAELNKAQSDYDIEIRTLRDALRSAELMVAESKSQLSDAALKQGNAESKLTEVERELEQAKVFAARCMDRLLTLDLAETSWSFANPFPGVVPALVVIRLEPEGVCEIFERRGSWVVKDRILSAGWDEGGRPRIEIQAELRDPTPSNLAATIMWSDRSSSIEMVRKEND
jgi:hypothetical protein